MGDWWGAVSVLGASVVIGSFRRDGWIGEVCVEGGNITTIGRLPVDCLGIFLVRPRVIRQAPRNDSASGGARMAGLQTSPRRKADNDQA